MDHPSGLSTAADRAQLTTAWNTTLRLNGAGIAVRFACLAILVVAALSVGVPAQWLLLLPSVLGLFLAAVDRFGEDVLQAPKSGVIERAAKRIVNKRREHIAGASLPGILEGAGIFTSALLLAGPFALPLTGAARVACVAAVLVLTGDILSQTLLDVSWFNLNFPPAPWMVAFRWMVPPLAAVIAFGVFTKLPPQAMPAPIALAASATFLLLWPWTALMGTAMRSSHEATLGELATEQNSGSDSTREVLHEVKDRLRSQASVLDEADPSTALERRVLERLLADVTMDWMRADPQNDDHLRVQEVWAACTTVEHFKAAVERGSITVDDRTGGWGIDRPGTRILRAILMDLTDNALTHGAQHVVIRIERQARGKRSQLITVTVDDDGPGDFPTTYAPGSSLSTLSGHCRHKRGHFRHEKNPAGGTRVIASYVAGVREPNGDGTAALLDQQDVSQEGEA